MTFDSRASIDAGQSSVLVRVRDARGVRIIEEPGVRNDRSTIEQIAALLTARDGYGAASVAIGLTGFHADPDAARLVLHAAPGLRGAVVAHDSITGYLAANGDTSGAVASVGTGVVVLGVGTASVVRVDGWGALLGDSGGAYWIGRSGLEMALRASDGRGPYTSLIDEAIDAFGPLAPLALAIQADPGRVSRVAAFARRVTAAAPTDDVANEIVTRAAGELARSIVAALDGAEVSRGSGRVSAVGQVMTSTILRDRVAQELERLRPGTPLEEPLGEPIDGVERLHELSTASPLVSAVVSARR